MPYDPYDVIGSAESVLSGTVQVNGVDLPVILVNLDTSRNTTLQRTPFANTVFGATIIDYYSRYKESGGSLSFYGLLKADGASTTASDILDLLNVTAGDGETIEVVIETTTYKKCKTVYSSLHTADVGGKRLVYGTLKFVFAYTA